MRNIIRILLLVTVLFSFLFFSLAKDVKAQNSYELFWPIVAGRTSEDPLYFLKLLKEKVRGVLIFSDVKKAEYYLFLSEKRLVEFENLVAEKKDIENAKKTLAMLRDNHSKVVSSFMKATVGGGEIEYINQRIQNSFGNQSLILEGLLSVVEGDLKNSVSETLSFLKSEAGQLR